MSKPFFEVFPTLKVKDDIQMMFQGVEVTKVSTNSTRDFIRVSIYSRHLIQKKDIYEVERMLKQQLFARSHIQVTVREQYDLSEQYTPENLMNEYYDSFLLELDQKSVVERNMLQNASYEFENGNILCLTLTDTIVAQGKKDSLSEYLTGVFAERFQRPGEAREADIGIAGGIGEGLLIKKGEVVKKVKEDELLETLRQELLHWNE